MAIVRGSCPRCGDVELNERDFTCYWVRYADTRREAIWFTFHCSECGMFVSRHCEARIYQMLKDEGAKCHDLRHPVELDEPRKPGSISLDDQLEYHNWLESLPVMAEP